MLSDRDRAILDFEAQHSWWRTAGAKQNAIREQFGISGVRYAQLLNRCLDNPEALAHAPQVVNRLRRIRAGRGGD
ncbi:DUF3263 domain-containing protein [Tsukamurella sp. NPDC003166]|uniref:DUF3263 domain-containing protein n=1 Tax=Tsukamurella sp. NPDC003166 TaxID=3154444 RepID=UPI0033A31037